MVDLGDNPFDTTDAIFEWKQPLKRTLSALKPSFTGTKKLICISTRFKMLLLAMIQTTFSFWANRRWKDCCDEVGS